MLFESCDLFFRCATRFSLWFVLYHAFHCATMLTFQGTDITVKHIFSCELDPFKRQFILDTYYDVAHVFGDCVAFEVGSGWCYKCNEKHEITRENMGVDVHFCGPVCKDLSKLNTQRADYYGAYSETYKLGTSGPTYRAGYKAVFGMS